jgi:hypothetical protein
MCFCTIRVPGKTFWGNFELFCDGLSVFFSWYTIVCFTDMPREKNLRGLLRSAVDRAVSKDSIVIVDSLNNIKVCVFQRK